MRTAAAWQHKMSSRKQHIDDFFDQYADTFNKAIKADAPDTEQTAGLYSECFIGANPLGVQCGRNDQQLKDFLKKGYAFYKEIGIVSMEIVVKEITILDEFHEMTRVRWRSDFIKKNGSTGSIEFENIYFTQTKQNQSKVFAWITGDEQTALKAHGLI